MIVKNESKIIMRLLESVAPVIDSFCICDTGSTDDTIEIIQTFFKSKQIPGKIVNEPFKDFGHNRTVALQAAATLPTSIAEYVLLMDADMVLWRHPDYSIEEFKSKLVRFNAFYLYQGSETFKYKNTRIVKNYSGFTYWGVTHEYVNVPEGMNIVYEFYDPKLVFIQDIGDGGSKGDKYERDIRLLTQGLVDIPNNDRYTFYLANTYRDHGDNDKAIEYYRKRIEIGGWIEEIWQSYYSIGRCYRNQGKHAEAIIAWLDAYHVFPNRIENLYEIINHYRVAGKNTLAHHFYLLAEESRRKYTERDHLFTLMDIYEYKLDYEMSIIGYYCNKSDQDLPLACMNTISHKSVSDGIFRNVLSNYKFYTTNISENALPIHEKNQKALHDIGRNLLKPFLGDFVSSTPSLCWDAKNGDLVVCVRYVNYKINEKGEYKNGNEITTKNILARFKNVSSDPKVVWTKQEEEYELKYDTLYDGRYVGLEDIRLFSYDKEKGVGDGRGRIIYNANRGFDDATPPTTHSNSKIAVEHGWIVQDATVNSKILQYEHQHTIEKNWALFGGTSDVDMPDTIKLKCVYSWGPLVIGTICPNMGKFTESHRFDNIPYFFKDVRCSTCGITIGNEIWFIGHMVSYEDRRYYYHIILILDANTYELKKYTKLWRFEKEQKVEYTLGFVHFTDTNRFLIGYSTMDRETKFLMISKHIFDDMMILHL
jgi:tetratricopeptide (TPR) repeat protein